MNTHNIFVQALNAEGPMTDVHKTRINRCYKDLVDNMNVDVVVDSLRSAGVLTLREDDERCRSRGTAMQARALLNILQRKSDAAFDKFVVALDSTGQAHLANLLVREGKKYIISAKQYQHYTST